MVAYLSVRFQPQQPMADQTRWTLCGSVGRTLVSSNEGMASVSRRPRELSNYEVNFRGVTGLTRVRTLVSFSCFLVHAQSD